MRRSDCRPMRCAPSLSASPARLRGAKPDGGQLRYGNLAHAALWKSGERPQLKHRFSKATLDSHAIHNPVPIEILCDKIPFQCDRRSRAIQILRY